MFQKLLRIRYIYIIAVVFTLINSVVFMITGIFRSIEGYIMFYEQIAHHKEGRPGVMLLEGLDSFLISLVFLIFGLGILKIFTHYHKEDANLPNWLKIDSFSELKILLWETILITIVILSISKLAVANVVLSWDVLIMPCFLLLLTISYFLVKSKKDK